jgi:hypothetical protein
LRKNRHFTPSSFDLLIIELNATGLINFQIDASFPSWGCEFYRTLINSEATITDMKALEVERLRLHVLIHQELKAQFEG